MVGHDVFTIDGLKGEVRYLLYRIPAETKGMLHTTASQDVVAAVGRLLAPDRC